MSQNTLASVVKLRALSNYILRPFFSENHFPSTSVLCAEDGTVDVYHGLTNPVLNAVKAIHASVTFGCRTVDVCPDCGDGRQLVQIFA